MNKSQQIYFDTGITATNKYLQVQLEQDIDMFEFMSLNIYTKDAYQDFNADYGVLVGRVIANGGIGVPNAKISIFIPLSDEDALDGTIASIYPYKTPRDKNNDGKRYNLLPRVSQYNSEKGDYSPKQPFGSFLIKPEIVTNQSFLDVYKKYYKYTALTNSSGDYMIFGVPIGTQTVHMSVDITDIGEYSMTPASMVTNLGYSPYLFTDNNTKIKPSNDLDDLPNIETQEIDVDVIPFWGDSTNFIIGITRQDFRIRATIASTFVLFGSVFTDGDDSVWGSDEGDRSRDPYVSEIYHIRGNDQLNTSIASKRIGKVTEKIYYYPNSISDSEITSGIKSNGQPINPITDMMLLSPTEYSIYKRDGDFVFIINCNRNKVITGENGVPEPVDENSTNGVYTTFRGFVTLEISTEDVALPPEGGIGKKGTITPTRTILKFPQYANRNAGFDYIFNSDGTINNSRDTNTKNWRKQNYIFQKNKYYSFSRFHGVVANERHEHEADSNNGYIQDDIVNNFISNDAEFQWRTGTIVTEDLFNDINNKQYQFPTNVPARGSFGANWINLSIHLPQFGYVSSEYSQVDYLRFATGLRPQVGGEEWQIYNSFYTTDNDQEIAAFQTNTKWFARSDLQWTDFIEVPVDDIREMNDKNQKGFTNAELTKMLIGQYHGGNTKPTAQPNPWPTTFSPMSGGKVGGNPNAANDPLIYFYKGFGSADCIKYLFELGLLTVKQES
jgi:hypothetical protein